MFISKILSPILFLALIASIAKSQISNGTQTINNTSANVQVNTSTSVLQYDTLFIAAKPQKVWEVLTNISQWPKWNSKIIKTQTDTNLTEGSKFEWETNGASIKSEIHTAKINNTFGWTGSTFGGTAIHNWYLEETENGTIVRVEESMQGWLVWIFQSKMNKDLKKDMRYWLDQLKKESERAN